MRALCFASLFVIACQPVPEVSKPAKNPPTADARVATTPTTSAGPVVSWAWVEEDDGSATQVSSSYAPWGGETIEYECSNHAFSTTGSLDCRRYRGDALWRIDRDAPGVSGDTLIERGSVFAAWAEETRTTIRAFDVLDGSPRWSTTVDAGGVIQLDVVEETLRLHDEHGTSCALDLSSGELLGASRVPSDLLAASWAEGPTEAKDEDGRTWTVRDGRLVGDSVVVELPQRRYRTDERREIRWSVAVRPSGLAVHERVDVPRFTMRWTHFYDFAGHELGRRRIISGSDHPGLWELHVVPERTLPPQ